MLGSQKSHRLFSVSRVKRRGSVKRGGLPITAKWKQWGLFAFMPPARSSRAACQTTFLWIIPDMRAPTQNSTPPQPPDTVWPSLGPLIGCTWLKQLCVCPRAKRGEEEIAESCVLRQVLQGQILVWLCTRGLPRSCYERIILL